MAKLCCLNKNYEWLNFGNHRYSHSLTETVSQKQSHSLIVMFQKQSHDITQTASQIAWNLPSTAITEYRHDFVSRGFEETLINLTAIEIFEYLLLQLNKLSNFSCDIDYIELCLEALHMGYRSLELQLQLLNICHWDIFECTLSYIGNTVMFFYIQ